MVSNQLIESHFLPIIDAGVLLRAQQKTLLATLMERAKSLHRNGIKKQIPTKSATRAQKNEWQASPLDFLLHNNAFVPLDGRNASSYHIAHIIIVPGTVRLKKKHQLKSVH